MFQKVKTGLCLLGGLAFLVFTASVWAVEPAVKPAPKAAAKPDALKIPDIVAKVNGVNIDSRFVKFKYNRMVKQLEREGLNEQSLDDKQKMSIVRDVIEKETIRELLHQAAKAQNKKANPKTVDQEMVDLKKSYENEQKFRDDLKSKDITEDSLKKNIEIDILIRSLIDDKIQGKVNISDDEAKKFYEDHKERFLRPESYKASHVFIPYADNESLTGLSEAELKKKQEELTKESEVKAKKILKEARSGADFTELAKKHSKDEASASKGGDLGFIYKGVFDPGFDEAISKMKPGEISDIVRTKFGHHIIKLMETRPSDTAPYADLKESIQKHLFMQKGQRQLQEFIEGLKKESKIETFF